MIDTFNDLTFEQFNTEKKEIMEEHIHYNEQDMNNDRELLEIKNFLESDGWSLIPQNQISNKFKTFDKNENKILLSQLKETWLDKLFEMNYLELFKYYYNDNKESPLDSIFFENKKIPLSKDTKSFSHLLKKNESTKEYIVEVTKSIYFCDNENDGTLFSTKTFP